MFECPTWHSNALATGECGRCRSQHYVASLFARAAQGRRCKSQKTFSSCKECILTRAGWVCTQLSLQYVRTGVIRPSLCESCCGSTMQTMWSSMVAAKELHRLTGGTQFRPNQEEACNTVLQGAPRQAGICWACSTKHFNTPVPTCTEQYARHCIVTLCMLHCGSQPRRRLAWAVPIAGKVQVGTVSLYWRQAVARACATSCQHC